MGYLVPLFFLMCFPAFAQDFETAWMDRIRQELREEAPLTQKPVLTEFMAGELLYFDTNISLNDDAESDFVSVTYFRTRVDYVEELFDFVGDLMINYNYYLGNSEYSDHEERLYSRFRYMGPSITFEVAEIFRRESDPIDATFIQRAERFVSNTIPRVAYDVSNFLTMELEGDLQFVQFQDSAFDAINNFNMKWNLSAIGHLTPVHDAFVQLGFLSVNYTDSSGPGNATGYSLRTGYRGELATDLQMEAFLGYTLANSSEKDAGVLDAQFHIRFHVTELLRLHLSYTRGIGFSGGDSSFQTVEQMIWNIHYSLMMDLDMTGRIHYENVDPSRGSERDFYSLGIGAEYRILENLAADTGLTYRFGRVWETDTGRDFNDFIFHIGVAGAF